MLLLVATPVSTKLKLAAVEDCVLPRGPKVIERVPEFPFCSEYLASIVSRTSTTVSAGLDVLGFAIVMLVSHLGFKKIIHPTPQSSPLVVHFGGDRVALDDIHIETHMFRLSASERAR